MVCLWAIIPNKDHQNRQCHGSILTKPGKLFEKVIDCQITIEKSYTYTLCRQCLMKFKAIERQKKQTKIYEDITINTVSVFVVTSFFFK